jgi:hypothetical protein
MMKRTLTALILTCAAALTPALAALEVKGVKFGDTFEVAKQPLKLNGAGVRVKLVFSVYAASLYLPQKQTSAQGVLTQSGPKSVQAVLLRELTSDEFVGAMIKGFNANNTEADVAHFKPRLEALETLMKTVGTAAKGTAIHIDFIPGTGTRITVDGQQKGADIPGEDFYQALLRIWLGNHPVDSDLKAALLTGE